MNAEELFLQKYGNKITASESWVIRFAEEYAKLKTDAVLPQADVRGQLIAFLRQQTKLHYVSIYENDFEFADKILKAINLP